MQRRHQQIIGKLRSYRGRKHTDRILSVASSELPLMRHIWATKQYRTSLCRNMHFVEHASTLWQDIHLLKFGRHIYLHLHSHRRAPTPPGYIPRNIIVASVLKFVILHHHLRSSNIFVALSVCYCCISVSYPVSLSSFAWLYNHNVFLGFVALFCAEPDIGTL